MKINRSFLYSLLLCACAGCEIHRLTLRAGAAGRVVDAKSGAVIRDAKVVLGDELTKGVFAAASTAADGRFRIPAIRERHVHWLGVPIENPPFILYSLEIQHQGYNSFSTRFTYSRWIGSAMTNFGSIRLEPLLFSIGRAQPTPPAPTTADAKPNGARLSQTEAVRIAGEAAVGRGYRLADYEAPEVIYEFDAKDRKWNVFYAGKVPAPGHHFLVMIDDQTGEARIWPGK